jgi:hypothetical protein
LENNFKNELAFEIILENEITSFDIKDILIIISTLKGKIFFYNSQLRSLIDNLTTKETNYIYKIKWDINSHQFIYSYIDEFNSIRLELYLFKKSFNF